MSKVYTFLQLFCGWNLPEKSTLIFFGKIAVIIIFFLTVISINSFFGLLLTNSPCWRNLTVTVDEILLAAESSLTREAFCSIDDHLQFSTRCLREDKHLLKPLKAISRVWQNDADH